MYISTSVCQSIWVDLLWFYRGFDTKNFEGPKGTIKVIAFISWAMEFLKLLSIEQDAFA